MAETRHIKLDYGETLDAKKQLLSFEINLIYINKSLSSYKKLRKREFALKNKLKTNITSLKSKLNFLLSTFPKDQGDPNIQKTKQREQETEEKNISNELEDIQAKLAKLK
tara:strand:- start:247 stop:576 length:330 start_codon:yes stop_codon:yes gene_type:complete